MPKSLNHIWSEFASWENWLLAYRRCLRRKRYKPYACEFAFDWEVRLTQLRKEVITHKWSPGAYYQFSIVDPKPRVISAAPFRDRIVHHALVNVLEPFFERRFIFDSYACRKGKGTHAAIKRAQYYQRRHKLYLKTDIVKFFPNIDHHLLRSQFHRLIRDSAILQIIDTVIQSGSTVVSNPLEPTWYPGDDLFSVLRPKGIPIGNLTSQFFANVFLDPVDHAMKETVRIPGYIRYADDILFFGDSKEQLWEACGKLKGILCGLRLSLHQDKTFVGQSDQGVRFLGCRVFPHQRRLAQTSLNRMQKRIRRWRQQAKERKVDFPEIRSSLQSWDSYARFCNSKMIRRRINKSLRLRFGKS
jgi:RNA-directed DNA polymerase